MNKFNLSAAVTAFPADIPLCRPMLIDPKPDAAVQPGPVVCIKVGDEFLFIREREMTYVRDEKWVRSHYNFVRYLGTNESVTITGTTY